MTTLVVPRHLREQVRQFADDFRVMSRVWIDIGAHDAGEVEYMREVIREAMACEMPPEPEVDGRPREERIVAWCNTFRALRDEWEYLNPPASGGIDLRDIVILTAAERAARGMR